MKSVTNIGPLLALEETIGTGWYGHDEVIIYRSTPDSWGIAHLILANIWINEGDLAHTFAYATEDDGSRITEQAGVCLDSLIEDLPPEFQTEADRVVTVWVLKLSKSGVLTQ
jgi:hypothetical protein